MNLPALIKFLKSVELVYTLEKNPMMKGENVPYVLEQSPDLKCVLKEYSKYKGTAYISVKFRLKGRK